MIDFPTFPAKHGGKAPISVATVLSRQLDHALNQQRLIIGNMDSSALRRARLTQNPTGASFRDPILAQLCPYLHHRSASLRRAQKFPEAASSRLSLSKAISATNFFSLAFSRSNSRERLA